MCEQSLGINYTQVPGGGGLSFLPAQTLLGDNDTKRAVPKAAQPFNIRYVLRFG